jgi:hypothetical protein
VTEKKKHKKVNRLNINECEAILVRLKKSSESEYYQHVLLQYRKLLPDMASAVALNQTNTISGATFKSSFFNNK